MIEITDEMADTAALAVLNATRAQTHLPPLRKMPIDQWNGGQLTIEVKAAIAAVAPLIAAQALAAERKFLVETLELVATLIDEDMRAKQYRGIEHDRSEGLALALADHIRARGDKP